MINKGLFTSDKDDWQTPKWLFDKLHKHFKFNLDVCYFQLDFNEL